MSLVPVRDIDFEKLMIEGAMRHQIDTATKFSRDRTLSVGASEIARCPRSIRYAKDKLLVEGVSDPVMNPSGGYMMRGKIAEDYFIAPFMISMLESEGYDVSLMGDDQQTFVSEDTEFLTATPDGKAERKDKGDFLIEYKTFDPRTNLVVPKPENVFQCHVQMKLTGTTTFCYLCYINASDFFDIRVWKIPYNEKVYLRAVERANDVRDKTVLELPKEGLLNDGCKYCEFKTMCKNDEVFDVPPPKKKIHGTNVKTFESKNVQRMAKKYIGIEDKIKLLKKQHTEIGAELAGIMSMSRNDHKVAIGDKMIELMPGKASTVLDKETLQDEFDIDLKDYRKDSDKDPKPRLKITLTRMK